MICEDYLKAKREDRWEELIRREPHVYAVGYPAKYNPGLGTQGTRIPEKTLCRWGCLRCPAKEAKDCNCRKGWSPRLKEVKAPEDEQDKVDLAKWIAEYENTLRASIQTPSP